METVKSFSTFVENKIDKNSIKSIAIGGFDGMHLAHQKLFSNLDENGAIICIETGHASLTPKFYRQEYSKYPIFFYDLDKIKGLDGVEFINLLKFEFPNLEKIVVGFDFAFGKDRSCNSNDLKKHFKGDVIVIDEVCLEESAIHSRYIREFLLSGDIKTANKFLGKSYKIYGKHIKGQGLGKKEFVATINLEVSEFLLPKSGVYITKTSFDGETYPSVSFLGHRNSTDNIFAVETHILDEEIEVIDKNVSIEFIERIRDNKKFNSFLELKDEIICDVNFAKKYFYEKLDKIKND
ncbi:bifunctional riboflavin kinase/FAD synthetase [Arcobacter porcinus]|uniref:bifunctional riboflavin kinase/FAD synthetase n=1 Tax=Arcobacter porcinus TaxID=1935204 RepID=UPI00081D68BA|nr:bifunctional riboflavin kinase/FAD synthetase [Arcobacter porcinus]OCL81793.1 Riboflavin biosynthesis protein RibF [Arcobacter porcinus]